MAVEILNNEVVVGLKLKSDLKTVLSEISISGEEDYNNLFDYVYESYSTIRFSVDGGSYTTISTRNLDTYTFTQIRTPNHGGNIALSIKCGTETFDITLSINGVTKLEIKPKNEEINYYDSKKLDFSLFDITIIDGFNTSVDISEVEESFISVYCVELHDQNIFDIGDFLDIGYYEFNLSIGEESDTTTFYCYKDIVSVNATCSRSYAIGEEIDLNDISGTADYDIGNDEAITLPLTDFQVSPKRFFEKGNQLLTIIVDGEDVGTTYVNVVSQHQDRVYYFDKVTLEKKYYAELQQNEMNMSFVLDNTKDSCQIIIYNHIKEDLKPNTIVYLESTNTWWIVNKDKSQRIKSEENDLYKHTISLEGAINVLNARDLIVHGYNVNRYTLGQMLERLMKMSDFELSTEFALYPYADKDQVVKYVKTFDNYTPYKAIFEIFEGLNLTPKMTFEVANNRLSKAIITPIPKNGYSGATLDMENFDGYVEETTSEKGNFGTRVISNVQNCISANVVRYPAVGGAKLTSNSDTVNYSNAILRLPSNVYKCERLHIHLPIRIIVSAYIYGRLEVLLSLPNYYSYDDNETIVQIVNALAKKNFTLPEIEKTKVLNFLSKNSSHLTSNSKKNTYDGKSGDWETFIVKEGATKKEVGFGFNDNIEHEQEANGHITFYTQGKDIVESFGFCNYFSFKKLWDSEDYRYEENYVSSTTSKGFLVSISSDYINQGLIAPQRLGVSAPRFAVDYIPMSDLKVKVENDREENDSDIYNQNGKLIDSKAVSKLINSHAKEISSSEITREKVYYNFFSVPKVGTLVKNNGEDYIINNVSIDFSLNESDNYYLDCFFTMTKQIACKSGMVNPNSNIRDYDIPQKNNIVRTQTYRDYLEFSYDTSKGGKRTIDFDSLHDGEMFTYRAREDDVLVTFTMKTDFIVKGIEIHNLTLQDQANISYGDGIEIQWVVPYSYTGNFIVNLTYKGNNGVQTYLPLGQAIDFQAKRKGMNDNHTVIIKDTMDKYGTYYYHLQCSKYDLSKQFIEVCDFKDNNIIGYEANGQHYIFQTKELFKNRAASSINTPITYVDDRGELISLDLLFVDEEQLNNALQVYDINATEFGAMVSVPNFEVDNQTMFQFLLENGNHDILIEEHEYKKDGLEVPVFEYVCQVGDSNGIVFGDDFLKGEKTDNTYYYVVSKASERITQENATLFMKDFDYFDDNLVYLSFDKDTRLLTLDFEVSGKNKGDNLVIWCAEVKNGVIVNKEFLFGINDLKIQPVHGRFDLFVETYKLK